MLYIKTNYPYEGIYKSDMAISNFDTQDVENTIITKKQCL